MVMENRATIKGTISAKQKLTGIITSAMPNIPVYDGPATIIPSDREQVLETKDLKLKENIVVEPIPSNYGKIEWDGARLRIS